ncbi:uncharacterized protein LOC120008723 [Tripterygium wilfordii]|uniref:uncharacterized protein LOC120008723 n=1 Tax=Tripterygium wilfordii TaxID=458696 RepID=UPI0018F7E5E1|nr:uncharacterized protein LOC120008723 [Tripterygium wilfordii]
MDLSIMLWNVQGAASPGFRRAFKTLIQTYKPKLVALFEPRCSGIKADEFIRKNRFERSHRVEAVGFSGGIWILWNEFLNVTVCESNGQFVHLRLIDMDRNSFITAVYGSPSSLIRKQLWLELQRIARNTSYPWLIGGDFNAILHTEDIKGGSHRRRGCKLFNSWVSNNHICELGFKGPRFTWSIGTVFERLDRALCNTSWFTNYGNSSVVHLPKFNSDHWPVLVNYADARNSGPVVKPFRFMASWLLHENFNHFVAASWETIGDYVRAAESFVRKVKEWNHNIFGDIFKKKRRLLARLAGIQRALEVHKSSNLARIEIELKKDLEEILWYQKSRKDWIQCGDRNTNYFHRKTL